MGAHIVVVSIIVAATVSAVVSPGSVTVSAASMVVSVAVSAGRVVVSVTAGRVLVSAMLGSVTVMVRVTVSLSARRDSTQPFHPTGVWLLRRELGPFVGVLVPWDFLVRLVLVVGEGHCQCYS